MYYRCLECWALTSSEYIDTWGSRCANCKAELVDHQDYVVDLPGLKGDHRVGVGQSMGTELVAMAYGMEASDSAHVGCWYQVPQGQAEMILPTPLAIVQSKGPGDALRFLHAASRLLSKIRSHSNVRVKMLAFIEVGFTQHIVGLYSRSDPAIVRQNAAVAVYEEPINDVGTICWVAMKQQPMSASTQEFASFANVMLTFIQSWGYRWFSPARRDPVILEPYHGKTRHFRYAGVQFARIDLNTELMAGYLCIPHRSLASVVRPPNTVRVLLYLRCQEDGRDTPWYHLEYLRFFQQSLAVQHTSWTGQVTTPIQVIVTLAGQKTADAYRTALRKLAPSEQKDTVVDTIAQWGWRCYCYESQSYKQQFAVLEGGYDLAVGINTSALDLAAAAGCVILRDAEWKQGEYEGAYYNTFLLAESTTGIFAWGEQDRKKLFEFCLGEILKRPFTLPRQYSKMTFDRIGPKEQVIGSL